MKKILFIGGDKRSITALREVKNQGYFAQSRGLIENSKEKIEDYDVLVLPVPSTKDKKTVYCPLTDDIITLDEIRNKGQNKLILSCGYSFDGLNNIDFLTLDGYSYLNAVPTAEGAIAFAIENTPFTIWKSRVLIIGNGRVSKILSSRLSSFGCDITVSARKESDFALLEALDIPYIHTSQVVNRIDDFDIIFNTVDLNIFENPNALKDKLLIDLSTLGCMDYKALKNSSIKAYKLPGIPGKIAPETAGKILASTVIKLATKDKGDII